MIDPLALLDDVFSGLDGSENPSVPGFEGSVPGAVPGNAETYAIDNNDISRVSRISRSENGDPQKRGSGEARDIAASPENVARTSSYVGTPGTPGNEAKSPAETTPLQFPVKDREPGTPGTESDLCGRLIPPSIDPLPISPSDVLAGVERELRALAEDGREGPDALRDAIAITAAKIRNAPAMAERQVHVGFCHACGDALDDSRPVVAVLQAKGGGPLWLHHGACCLEHSRRRAALVAEIMMRAGYGAEATGEAA